MHCFLFLVYSGTNQFASQKGMSMGSIRHVYDGQMSQEGQGIINLQSGTNQFASQRGMSIGAVRHIADIKTDPLVQDSQAVIRLQAGTNQFATQNGMNFGKPRGINDIKVSHSAGVTSDPDQFRRYYDYDYQVPGRYQPPQYQDDDDGWL